MVNLSSASKSTPGPVYRMENQMEKKMENEMETGGNIGI